MSWSTSWGIVRCELPNKGISRVSYQLRAYHVDSINVDCGDPSAPYFVLQLDEQSGSLSLFLSLSHLTPILYCARIVCDHFQCLRLDLVLFSFPHFKFFLGISLSHVLLTLLICSRHSFFSHFSTIFYNVHIVKFLSWTSHDTSSTRFNTKEREVMSPRVLSAWLPWLPTSRDTGSRGAHYLSMYTAEPWNVAVSSSNVAGVF